MNVTPKILAVLAVVLALVMLTIWWATSKKPATNSPIQSQTVPGIEQTNVTSRTNESRSFAPRVASENKTNGVATQGSLADTTPITNWQETVDEVLREDGESGPKGKRLLELFPRFPEEGQIDVAQHIANLLPDEDYAPFAAYFTSTNTPVDVQDVIMADLLGRPNSIKLPTLLEAARSPQHSKASDAKDLLELYLEKDYGTDWDRWQKEMEIWLKANPD
jgi:hypothetical protein